MELDAAKQFLDNSRFWVQRVLVPILVMIGVGGNVVTVMVLTRRRMRCSTNIYLTALAVADLIYLLFVLVLSFEHYPHISDFRYELYWRFYGITHWLADAASSTSIWLIVCFTIERYIAVCHPIRGKVLCTENRAKRAIAAVSILCILATMSTSFEYQLTTSVYCEEECPIIHDQEIISNQTVDINEIQNDEPSLENREEFYIENCANNTGKLCYNNTIDCQVKNEELITLCLNETTNNTMDGCCKKSIEIQVELTNLGRNQTYKTVFYWFTSITFTFLPLTLIATFNCFLVNVVRKSQKQRKQMTKSQENSTQAQENRMTLILIAVVILFLICQTPMACILIYTSIYKLDRPTEYLVRGLGNIFNLLVSINAACNFLLYCALSDKYRRTFRALFCRGRGSRGATWLESSASTLSRSYRPRGPGGASVRQPTSQRSQNGFRRNVSASAYVPRNFETQVINSIPRAKTLIVRPTDKGNVGKSV